MVRWTKWAVGVASKGRPTGEEIREMAGIGTPGDLASSWMKLKAGELGRKARISQKRGWGVWVLTSESEFHIVK